MRRRSALVLICIAMLGVTAIMAQNMGKPGRGPGARNYNPATEVTINGTVEDVLQPTGQRGMQGVHLNVKSDQGSYEVHLGPASYISGQQFAFAKGDAVEIVGSKTTMGGKDVIIAREVKKQGKTLTLRDAQGLPKWSGGPAR